jgi:hypothetical protein
VRGKCVHPGNLRRQRPRNDRLVPRNSPKSLPEHGGLLTRLIIQVFTEETLHEQNP